MVSNQRRDYDMSDFRLPEAVICPADKNGYLRLLPLDDKTREDDSDYVRLYKEKHNIISESNVSSIMEIGVRAGYSAYTFKSAFPNATYLGMDAENGSHGGAGGPWTWWAKITLDRYFPKDLHKIVIQDTQQLERLPEAKYDFIHIDGDHTVAGVYHDLDICVDAVNPGGRMCIDDYTHLPDVKVGVDKWLEDNVDKYDHYKILKTVRGDVVIYIGE